jgi:DMSO/TMAO reductase YedYZ molybdopterin-dependent catalytic subunit
MMKKSTIAMAAVLVVAVLASIFMYGTYGQTKNSNPGVEQLRIDFSYTELTAMPGTTVNAELDCIGNYVASGNWTGVRLGYLLERAEVTQQADTVEFYASDGYSTHITYTVATRADVIVAYQLNGNALPEITRLVIPDTNGDVWISNITRIKIVYPSGDYSSITFN